MVLSHDIVLRSPQNEGLHELMAERSTTIVTSNLSLAEWQQALANQLLSITTIARLQHNAYQVILEGKIYRSLKPTRKQEK